MYICEECGAVFSEDEIKIAYERHPYGEGYATEEHYCCPGCGEGGFEKAVECTRCGEYFLKGTMKLDDNLNYMCDCCYGEVYGE